MVDAAARSETRHALLIPGFMDQFEHEPYVGLVGALNEAGIITHPLHLFRGIQIAGHYTQLMSDHLDALRAALDRILAAGNEMCALIGYCYGGNLAFQTAARDHRVSAVAAVMPTNFFLWAAPYDRRREETLASRTFTLPDGPDDCRTSGPFGIPRFVLADARKHDTEVALLKIRQPALFVAGGHDDVIPPEAVADLYTLCGSTTKTLSIIDGVEHDYRHDPHQIEQVSRTVADWATTHIVTAG